MLTRCPDCATTFRVHAEQLKVRQGRVRCGECQCVFNALDSLVEELLVLPGDEKAPVSSVPGSGRSTRGPSEASAEALIASVPIPEALMAHEATMLDAQDKRSSVRVLEVPAGELTAPEVSALGVVESRRPRQHAPNVAGAGEAPQMESEAEFESGMHDEAVVSDGRSNWFWASGIVLAIVALLLQGIFHFRVEIATLFPQAREPLTRACEAIGCRVDLPRKIELLSIESSDLHPDPAFPGQTGRLRLQSTVRNRAPFAQAWPHLEMTLTDVNDRVVARRVLSASEYLLAKATPQRLIEHGIGAAEDVSLDLALDTGSLVASGYRVYLFYP